MRIIAVLSYLLFLATYGLAQPNLVLNPGFEKGERSSDGSRYIKAPGYLIDHWYVPTKRSPDYYSEPEESIAKAHSGSGAVGLVWGSSKPKKTRFEYLTGELSQPLKKGEGYCVSVYVLLHRTSKWAASNVGILFHHDQKLISNVSDRSTLEADLYLSDGGPVINTKWQRYCGYFVASGGEEYISFGMLGEQSPVSHKELEMDPYFQLDGYQTRAYYQLDDVSVVKVGDTTDCGCAEPPEELKDTISTVTDPPPYLFALDASGSMRKNALFDSLRHNLAELLQQLPNGTPVTFSTFASSSEVVYTGVTGGNTAREVDSLLGEVKLGGGTHVYDGLEEAYNSLPTSTRDSARLVLISDGVFTVTNKIENIVKQEFENKGRRLTVVQIEGQAKGWERLEPYQASHINTTPSELRHGISQIYRTAALGAVACECVDEYSDTMNYHFVIDYSGSMAFHKKRGRKALTSLYEKAPETAVISITAFSNHATELYVGRKADMSTDQIDSLLSAHKVGGGTNPAPGVNHGLGIAHRMSEGRFSHLIVITDLDASKLNATQGMTTQIANTIGRMDLAVSSITVNLNLSLEGVLISDRAQFDVTKNKFRGVSKSKFEKDLFDTRRSSCDYTTQPYHYDPAKAQIKEDAKKGFGLVLREIFRSGTGVGI